MSKRRAEKSELVSLRIPHALSVRVASVAKRRRQTVSAVIRQAIEQAVSESREQTVWELMRPLVRRLEKTPSRLPADLSTNPKYLEGLGR